MGVSLQKFPKIHEKYRVRSMQIKKDTLFNKCSNLRDIGIEIFDTRGDFEGGGEEEAEKLDFVGGKIAGGVLEEGVFELVVGIGFFGT